MLLKSSVRLVLWIVGAVVRNKREVSAVKGFECFGVTNEDAHQVFDEMLKRGVPIGLVDHLRLAGCRRWNCPVFELSCGCHAVWENSGLMSRSLVVETGFIVIFGGSEVDQCSSLGLCRVEGFFWLRSMLTVAVPNVQE